MCIAVAVIAGTLLPHLAARDRRLMRDKGDVNEDAEVTRLRSTVRLWRAEAVRQGKPLRLPVMPFLLRNIWTGALLLFTVLTFWTFFITTVIQVCEYPHSYSNHVKKQTGDCHDQFGGYMLGGSMLGAICHHYGGT